MNRPGATPIEFSTKLIADHLRELQNSVVDDDDMVFDDVAPRLNLPAHKMVAVDLPKIEVEIPEAPAPIKRKPFKFTKRPAGPAIVDIEYEFNFTPTRIEAPPVDIPEDYGDDYMTTQLLDLTFQFARLSTPTTPMGV